MKRYAEKEMMSWFKGKNRKPLVLRGARQVGKSTLVRQFAAAAGLTLNEINLERHMNLVRTFASFDIPRILEELGVIVGHSVDFDDNMPERQTIVLDAGGEAVEYELTSLPLYAIGAIGPAMGLMAQ